MAEHGDFLTDVLHECPGHRVLVEDEDEVLPVRHEYEIVREQRMHERFQVGPQVAAHPCRGAQPRGVDQFTSQGHTLMVPVQQRGHRDEPLTWSDLLDGVLPP